MTAERQSLCLLGLVLVCASCDAPEPDLTARTTRIGDTTVVTNAAPARWGPPDTLVEDLRVGDGDDYTFARLQELAVDSRGTVIVYDIFQGRVHRFDSAGNWLGQLGQSGQGPGEYSGVMGVAVDKEDRVFLHDLNGRISVFDEDGSYLYEIPYNVGRGSGLRVLENGRPVVQIAIEAQGRWEGVFVDIDRDGTLADTIGPFFTPWDSDVQHSHSLYPRKALRIAPGGTAIVGVSSNLALQIHAPNGEVFRTSMAFEPVPLLDQEREDWKRANEQVEQRSGRPVPEVPDTKPVFTDVLVARTGEVWVELTTESEKIAPYRVFYIAGLYTTPEWLSPTRFAVFNRRAEFLREVVGPAGFNVKAISGDTLWGFTREDDGRYNVSRFVVVSSSG